MKTTSFLLLSGFMLMLNIADRNGIGYEVSETAVEDRETESSDAASDGSCPPTENRDDNSSGSPTRKDCRDGRFNEKESRFHSSLRDTEMYLLQENIEN